MRASARHELKQCVRVHAAYTKAISASARCKKKTIRVSACHKKKQFARDATKKQCVQVHTTKQVMSVSAPQKKQQCVPEQKKTAMRVSVSHEKKYVRGHATN